MYRRALMLVIFLCFYLRAINKIQFGNFQVSEELLSPNGAQKEKEGGEAQDTTGEQKREEGQTRRQRGHDTAT